MITREQLEKKFLLKNKAVVITPDKVPMKAKREKRFKVEVEYKNHKTLLEDAYELENYLKTVGVKKNESNLYHAQELNDLLKRNKELYFSNKVNEYKVTKIFYFRYTLDNKDTQITFDSTDKLVEFLNNNNFTI